MTALAAESPESQTPAGTLASAHAAATTELCVHCGLEVPAGLRRGLGVDSFCCAGCEAAYAVIHSCGLENYYALLKAANEQATPARASRRAYAEFDDPVFHSLYCHDAGDGLTRVELMLEGVHCTACVWLVEKLPRVAPGVIEARLDIRRAAVEVTFDRKRVPLSEIARCLHTLGYPAHPARSPAAREARRASDRRMLVRMGVAGACAGNIMLLFFALYAGMFEGMERGYELLFRWVALALNTLCLAWPGAIFARSAIASLRTRSIHLDVPIAMGLYLGGIWGFWKTVAATWSGAAAGASDIYFDSISALIFFLLVGRFLQQRQQRAAADSLEMLFAVTPAVARIVRNADENGAGGVAEDVPSESLKNGDLIEVRAGDSIPADGVVTAFQSRVDLSLLSGESRPVAVGVGDAVAAGSVNLESTIRVRVHATGEATRVGKLMRLVEDASRRRAAIVLLADRWGAWLLFALLGLAAITLAIWWRTGPAIAIDHAIALLIATCPCGLGLATPLAMTVALGRAARRGILIKGGDALQSLAQARGGTIVLDKTGTITRGMLSVLEWNGDDSITSLVAALEAHSSHPSAKAMADHFRDDDAAHIVEEVHQHAGAGIGGMVDGRQLRIGSQSFLESRFIAVSDEFKRYAARLRLDGVSPVFVAADGVCVGVAALGDPVRSDAAAAIAKMRRRGWRVMVLSGDHPDVVASTARAVGIGASDCRAPATPEEKLAAIVEMRSRHPVVMVGDGVNDAAALAAATVGIAVRGGAEAALTAADVSMSREGLGPIVELLDGAHRTMRTIHWTIATSLAYNVLAASLSMAGMISPLLAAFIMPASSLTVVAVCLRGGAFRLGRAGRIEGASSQPQRPEPRHAVVQGGTR